MIKAIRILEVPLLLLIMAIGCIQEGAIGVSIFLGTISVLRLWVNIVTDDTIYRNQNNMKKIIDKIIKSVPLKVWKKIPKVYRVFLWIKTKL